MEPKGDAATGSPRPGHLVQIDGRRTPMRDGLMIGRNEQCGLQLVDTSVSREHAALRRGQSHWTIVDRGSRNGTTLNLARIPMFVECPLRDGDRLGIGRVLLTVVLAAGDDPEQTSGIYAAPELSEGDALSPYQLQVVRRLAEPWLRGGEPATNAEIAAALGTPNAIDAVKAALRRAYVKTGLAATATHTKRRELCRIAHDRRWL